MNKNEKEIISQWINSKWEPHKRVCEVCEGNNWVIAEDIITPVILTNLSMVIGSKAYPQVMMICSNCANTKYFNIALMGVKIDEKKDG